MPRTCSICAHAARDQIEAGLLEGKPFRELATSFGTSSAALFRHRQTHIPDRLVKLNEIEEVSKAETLLEQLDDLKMKARQIQEKAEKEGDFKTALAGVRELARLIELVGKLTGELRVAQINILNVDHLDAATAERMAEAFLEERRKERS
jgi:phage FluMu protein gp41